MFSCLNANSSSEWNACRLSHTPLIWLTISFVLPNHKQFIRMNCMLCITHASIWLPVSFVPPHRKQFIELNSMPFIAHATKTWTMFDASVITNVLHISDGFHTAPFAIMASHTVSRRVSDCSVALAASCSSVIYLEALCSKFWDINPCCIRRCKPAVYVNGKGHCALHPLGYSPSCRGMINR